MQSMSRLTLYPVYRSWGTECMSQRYLRICRQCLVFGLDRWLGGRLADMQDELFEAYLGLWCETLMDIQRQEILWVWVLEEVVKLEMKIVTKIVKYVFLKYADQEIA